MYKLEVGAYNKLPHYAVIGEPVDFYIWINEDGRGDASQWIKGNAAFNLYYKLRDSSNEDFISLVKKNFNENRK